MTVPRHLCAAVLIATCIAAPDVAAAQSSPFRLPVGSRVKLEYGDTVRLVPIGFNRHRLTGTLRADSAGAYHLQLPTGDMLALRHGAVTNAWSSRGASRGASALVMGLSTAVTGYFVTGGGWRSTRSSGRDQLIGAAVGAGIGALIGAIRPYEMWRRVRR